MNTEIDRFNITTRAAHGEFIGGGAVVGLKNVGIRTNSRRKMSHDLVQWREKEVKFMLHLVPDQQARTAMRVLKFFQTCTPNAPTQYFPVPNLVPTPAPDQNPNTVPDVDLDLAVIPDPAASPDPAPEGVMAGLNLAALDETTDEDLAAVDEAADLHLDPLDETDDFEVAMDDAAGADLATIDEAIDEAINEAWGK